VELHFDRQIPHSGQFSVTESLVLDQKKLNSSTSKIIFLCFSNKIYHKDIFIDKIFIHIHKNQNLNKRSSLKREKAQLRICPNELTAQI